MSSEKNTDVHPVAVVKSSQPLLAEEFIEKLKKELLAASPKLLFESKNLDDVSLSEIVEDARTLPMFHERKLIVAKGYDGLGKEDLDLLNKYAAAPRLLSRCWFCSPGGPGGARRKPQRA